jgi:hypothetical protein
MTSVAHGTYDNKITGLAGVAVRVGTALEEWGRNSVAVTDRDELELRHWAENEAELAREAREALINRQLYVIR